MSTRPWMKFYPSDWLGSSRLRRCSFAARGLAIELICHMHQGEPYGHLTVKGNAALARLVGMSRRDVPKLVTELVQMASYLYANWDQKRANFSRLEWCAIMKKN
jgi:hypothetical protein